MKYIREGMLDIRLRIGFFILGFLFFLTLRPWIAEQSYNRAITFFSTSNFDNSIKHLKRAIFLYPRFTNAYNTLALVYELRNQYEDAKKVYQKSFKYDPKNARGYFSIGVYYASQKKDYIQAIKWFTNTIEVNPYYWEAYLWLGICYEALKLKPLALKNYYKMKKYFPNDSRVKGFINSLLKK
jgi:superkiller protein 3